MSNKNTYSNMQKGEYNQNSQLMIGNHKEHNDNPDYEKILLAPIAKNAEKWQGKKALDFGCGHGRNVTAMLNKNVFERVDGVDICDHHQPYFYNNIKSAGHEGKSSYFINNGLDLEGIESEKYSFIMSTIVFQHICVHEIRYCLLSEIFRILEKDGVLMFQMGFGPGHPCTAEYHHNIYDAHGTNSQHDVRVDNPNDIIHDLTKIGFTDITYEISHAWSDRHDKWIYVQCKK